LGLDDIQRAGQVFELSITIINESLPLFLLTVFGKGEKANLTKAERNDLAKYTSLLIKNYRGQK